MNEPSVLDYVKSIFKSWDSFLDFLQAVFDNRDTTQMDEFQESVELQIPTPEASSNEIAVETPQAESLSSRMPWLILAVLFFALIGQMQFEPPQTLYPIGIIFYILMLGLAGMLFVRGQWNIARLPSGEVRLDTFAVRSLPFIASLILNGLTFYSMSENRFTTGNVSLWFLTLLFHIIAFWASEPDRKKRSFDLIGLLSKTEWKISITRQTLLVLAVFGIALFFGFYKLYNLPGDMTSDHAEKLLDVYDITQGKYSIFFTRNTGREPLQFYLVAFLSQWYGISFLSLKISTVLMGMLTLIYIYLLGRELGGERVALFALMFAAIGCWPVLIDRIGLRFAYYPPFAAATLYYFIRGLRLQRRNDFILAGIALGIGLNGYSPMRIVPLAMIVFFLVYFFHLKDAQSRKQAVIWFGLLAFTAWILLIPLARYAVENPYQFSTRALSRIAETERPLPGPIIGIFLQNLWVGAKVFNWYSGNTWTFTLPSRPALDFVSAALFTIGVLVVIFRYSRQRNWQDLVLLLAIPLLQLPSTLALAFPDENPALNRMSAAFVPVFLIVGIALDSIVGNLSGRPRSQESNGTRSAISIRSFLVSILVLGLFGLSFLSNYDLVFNQYESQYKLSNWNTRDLGLLMKQFADKGGSPDQAWIIPYPFWADTRLPLFWSGDIYRGESAIMPENLPDTVPLPGKKMFIFNMNDLDTMHSLQKLYPKGVLTIYQAAIPSKSFYVFRVDNFK